MDIHLFRGSRGWVGPDPEWQRTGTAAGAGDGAECGLHSPVLVPEEGNHWEPSEILTYQKSQQDHWIGQRFQQEMGKVCLLGRKRNEYGQAGYARAPWLCLLGGFGAVLSFIAAYGKFLSSLSVKALCTVKYKTEKVELSIMVHIRVPGCWKLLMTICKLRRCQRDTNVYSPAIPRMKRWLLFKAKEICYLAKTDIQS